MSTTSKPTTPGGAKKKRFGLTRINFKPALTREQVFSQEADYNEVWGTRRRVTLMTLTRTQAELVDSFLDKDIGPEVMFEMVDHITEFRDHARALAKLADAAVARVYLAGQAAADDERATEPS